MSLTRSRPFTILCIMVLALTGPRPESVTAQTPIHPYVSEFQYVPQHHPSRNPDCASRWFRREHYEEQFEYRNHRRSSFEEPLVGRDRPWIEIRAVLVRCSKARKRVGEALQPIRNCKRKVIISMKMNNVGKTNTREEFVLVDRVLDPVKMRKIRLHNPYVIKVRQEPLMHLYGLTFQGIVNAEAREEVINNRRANFTGCNDGFDNPTCGQMLINGESIPFSQGFCCSCEDAQRGRSSHSTAAAESNHRQRDGSANSARNRSEPSANLFDNPKAPRQHEASANEGQNRRAGTEDARVTSHDTSAVNGLLGEERAPPLRDHRREKQLGSNATRSSTGGFSRAGDADRADASPALKSVLSDLTPPNEGKIEAYVDLVYRQAVKERAMRERAMRERAMQRAAKQDINNRSEDLSDEGLGDSKDRPGEIVDSATRGSVASNPGSTTARLTNTEGNCDSGGTGSRETSPRPADRSDGRSSSRGPVTGDPRDSAAKFTKSEGGPDREGTGGEDNRRSLEPEECDGSASVSESGDRGRRAKDRSCGAARLENTFDHTPPSRAIRPSRIPQGSEFSGRTETSALPNGPPGNGGAAESFSAPAAIASRSGANYESVNYGVTSPTLKPSGFGARAGAPLSETVISGTRPAGSEGPRVFGAPGDAAGNVNAPGGAPPGRRNLSAAAIRNDNASGGAAAGEAENANASTRIPVVPALARSRGPPPSSGLSGELSALAARPAAESPSEIDVSRARDSPSARGSASGSLREDQRSRGTYDSSERASKRARLWKGYKYRKSGGKSRKGAGKDAKRFRESSPSRKFARGRVVSADTFGRERTSPRRRRRRHLRAGSGNFDFANADGGEEREKEGESGSRRKTQAFVDYCARPDAAHHERGASGGPRKQATPESGHSRGNIQPGERDNPFPLGDAGGKESNADKRIGETLARISDVLREDSAGAAGIIQGTPGDSAAAAWSEVAGAENGPGIPRGPADALFSRAGDKPDEPVGTREYPAGSIGARQRTAGSKSSPTSTRFTTSDGEVASAIRSPFVETRKDGLVDRGRSAAVAPTEKLTATVIGPFLSSPALRKLGHEKKKNASKVEIAKSRDPARGNDFAAERTEFLARAASPVAPRGGNAGPLGTSLESRASPARATASPGALNNRDGGERDGAAGAALLGLNNNSSRVIAGNFAGPRGPPVGPRLSLCGGGDSVIKPGKATPGDEAWGGPRCAEGAPPRDSGGVPKNEESSRGASPRSRGIAERLADRIVRQYAPAVPSPPTFGEVTEAKTSPSLRDGGTAVAGFTTATSATTTVITDVAFRPSIHRLEATSLPEEVHDEVSLDEITFADETEATAAGRETTVFERKFQSGRLDAGRPSKGRASETGRSGGGQRGMTNRGANVDATVGKTIEEEDEDHPWRRTTEMREIIAANRPGARKAEGRRKPRRKSKTDYLRDAAPTAPTAITSSAADEAARARTRGGGSAELVRGSGGLDFPIFRGAEDEEDRRRGRAAPDENGEFPDGARPAELRSRIEKRSAGELDYSAERKSSVRRNCENQDRTQRRDDVAGRDVTARNIEHRAVGDPDERRFLNSAAREEGRGARDGLKSSALPRLRRVRDDAVGKLEEGVPARDREASTFASRGTRSRGLGKIAASRRDLLGSAGGLAIDGLAVGRKIAADPSAGVRTAGASASDLSRRGAEPRRESRTTGRILPGSRARRGRGDRDESRETDAIVRGAKLMTAGDKSGTRDPGVAAKSVDKKTPSPPPSPSPVPVAKEQGGRREDASKIDENPRLRVRRVAGAEYRRRARDEADDTIREMSIAEIEKGQSSSREAGIARSEVRAGRTAPADRRPSGRRLLSSGKSSYADGEYYGDGASGTDAGNDSASDDEAIAGGDDLSDCRANQAGPREDRDSRKLAGETDRSADGQAGGVARAATPQGRTVAAACDGAITPDEVQAVGEQAISSSDYRNNGKEIASENADSEEKHGIDAILESTDSANFNNNKILEAPFETEEKSVISSDNSISAPRKSLDEPESVPGDSQTCEEVDEEPLSLDEKVNEDNLRDESLYGTEPSSATFSTTESSVTDRGPSGVGKTLYNADSRQSSATPGNVEISLSGRIHVNGGFNRTPILISFDAVPGRSAAAQRSVSAGPSDAVAAVESTAINLPHADSIAESAFDLSSITERADDAADNSLNAAPGEDREAEEAGAGEVAAESREKFFDLARGGDEERETAEKALSRVERRLDKYNGNSGAAERFSTDRSRAAIAPSGGIGRTRVERTISGRANEAVDKSSSPSAASPVRFPDILGSVLINNGGLRNWDASRGSQRRAGVPSIAANRSEFEIATTGRTEVPNGDLANDRRNVTTCCPGGCYGMPATVRQLELPATTWRESRTRSDCRGGDPAGPRNAAATGSSTRNGAPEAATERTASETLQRKCDDESTGAIRATNMMAVVRFMTKLLSGAAESGFRRSGSDRAGDAVGPPPMLPRDIGVSARASSRGIGAARADESARPGRRSRRIVGAAVSDRRAARTRLLNGSARGVSPADWIGEGRAGNARQLPVDKKRRGSRGAPGGPAATAEVAFRRVRGGINRPRDPNRGHRRSDSFKIEGRGRPPAAKLSAGDALSISGGSGSLEGADLAVDAIRHSPTSAGNNLDISEVGGTGNERARVADEKDGNERRDSRRVNRVFKKRQAAPSPTGKKKTKKWRRKKKRKKGGQRKDVLRAGNQRFKRHLLMAAPEPVYDVAARLPGRYAARRRNADNFRRSAGEESAGRREDDGDRAIDGSEADRAQIRGGQDCTDRGHPANIDAAKYLESAHCLRFSDLWYSVYQLEDPVVEHTVYLQVYEKRALPNGSSYWEDLTADSVVRLSTFNRHHRGGGDTLAFAYKEVKTPGREEVAPNLDVVRDRLLVPSSVTSKGSGYPIEGESGEYLVVPASGVNGNGNECDKAGVGFAAFAEQPDRCERVRGTCLKNQPLAYRRHDAEARAAGRPGCYFLSNFASVPSEPIKYSANGRGSREFLALEYHSPHVSAIDIEVKAGHNAALATGPLGRIGEVRVDSMALDHTVITVVMANTGPTLAFYRSKIADCPEGLPESWVNATFPKKIVQPRRDQTVRLDLHGELPINEFYCSVQLLNRLGEPVATRRIKIRKMDRCSCTLQCLCVCVGETRGAGCRPMSTELYHAAGFRGPVPAAPRDIFSSTTVDILLFIASSMLLLLFMGFLKWLIGLYIPAVGRWGLDSLLETNGMPEYFEGELKCKCVVTDEHGAPVHPDTRKRTVRICSRKAEFFLNAMFFLIFPLAVCCYRLKKCLQPDRRRRSDESKISLTSDRSERLGAICVSTHGDNRGSQMGAEDTRYATDERRKSEELLRSYNRSKVRA